MVPTVFGPVASIVNRDTPQYSVSKPFNTSPFEESVETVLQNLQLSPSQEEAAQLRKKNAAP